MGGSTHLRRESLAMTARHVPADELGLPRFVPPATAQAADAFDLASIAARARRWPSASRCATPASTSSSSARIAAGA
jgi:hypothetical protein